MLIELVLLVVSVISFMSGMIAFFSIDQKMSATGMIENLVTRKPRNNKEKWAIYVWRASYVMFFVSFVSLGSLLKAS